MAHIYTFQLEFDWKMLEQISQVDKFEGVWSVIEKREGSSLKELKSIATVRSTGASTRIEGARMTDDEVSVLIHNLSAMKLVDRDQQEVAGYYETLDMITNHYADIAITESNIRHIHNMLMKYSEKDAWHRGSYKQHSNIVEATQADGTRYTVFQTTPPGFETDDAMRRMVEWYNTENNVHPVIKSALLAYEFLSIHPFQDGNGRLSRLLATLLLLKAGYTWVQYVSFEHEIEHRKAEYYKVLMDCQRQRPGEDVYNWVMFFLSCLNNIREQFIHKLSTQGNTASMSVREKRIYTYIETHPGSQSGDIAARLDIPLPTVKREIAQMVKKQLLVKHGIGAGTHYTVWE